MHAPKIKLRTHTYQYTTEKIQVINRQSKDTYLPEFLNILLYVEANPV